MAKLCLRHFCHDDPLPGTLIFAELLGAVSRGFFAATVQQFFDELAAREGDAVLTAALLRHTRYVELKVFPQEDLEASFAFLKVPCRFCR